MIKTLAFITLVIVVVICLLIIGKEAYKKHREDKALQHLADKAKERAEKEKT